MKKNILFYLLVSTLVIGCNSKNKTSSVNEESNPESNAISEEASSEVVFVDDSSETEEISSEEITSSEESTSEETLSEEISLSEETSSPEEISSEEPSSEQLSSEEISSSEQIDIWTNDDVNDYYANLDLTLTGDDLLANLQSINSKKRKSTVGYSNMLSKTAANSKFLYTDYDPNDRTKVIAFYRETSAIPTTSNNTMNREHVWPESHGGNLVEADIHMPRPTLCSDNSDRGNSFYVEGKCDTKYGWDPYTAGMTEYYRGICARIIFYCCVASNRLSLVDVEYSATSKSNPDYKMGKLSDLLKWNLRYPVDDTELRRNNGAQQLQGNRNPFIDNPNFACAIWGSYNSETKKICAGNTIYSKPAKKNIPVKPRILENYDNVKTYKDKKVYQYN